MQLTPGLCAAARARCIRTPVDAASKRAAEHMSAIDPKRSPVGREITNLLPEFPPDPADQSSSSTEDDGSILIIVGTDAPVSAITLKAMAKRAALGLARNGATANPTSGDVVLAFATTRIEWAKKPPHFVSGETLFPYAAEHLYRATVQATEEAVINALVAARTMTGLNGSRVHALLHNKLRDVLRHYNRLQGQHD